MLHRHKFGTFDITKKKSRMHGIIFFLAWLFLLFFQKKIRPSKPLPASQLPCQPIELRRRSKAIPLSLSLSVKEKVKVKEVKVEGWGSDSY